MSGARNSIEIIAGDVDEFTKNVLEALDESAVALLNIECADVAFDEKAKKNIERLRAAIDRARSNCIATISVGEELVEPTMPAAPANEVVPQAVVDRAIAEIRTRAKKVFN